MSTETKAAWTPGPWSADPPRNWLANRWKCSVRVGNERKGNSIAEVYLGGKGALLSDAHSVEANARLISKAPEMAELLRDIIESATDGRNVPEWLLERLKPADRLLAEIGGDKP